MSLLTDLISYWKLDEASGSRSDSHGTNHLTDNNTVTSATGKINSAAQFAAGNLEYLSVAGNSSLQCGGVDFTWAFWAYPQNSATNPVVLSRDQGSNRQCFIQISSGFWKLLCLSGNGTGAVAAFDLTVPVTDNNWYFVCVSFNAITNEISCSVNNSTGGTNNLGAPIVPGLPPLEIGRYSFAPGSNYYSGLIDEVGFWQRVLTGAEKTKLYNGGAGLPYGEFNAIQADGTSSGTSTVSGVGISAVIGTSSSSGTSTASGIGTGLILAVGNSSGLSSADGISSNFVPIDSPQCFISVDFSDLSSLCEEMPQPLLTTGILIQWMRMHFSDSDRIETEMLQDYVWTPNNDDTGIVIDSVFKFNAAQTEARPGIFIKRNTWRSLRYGINDRKMLRFNDADYQVYVRFYQGSHTLYCIAGESAEAELLATEVYRELVQAAPGARKLFNFLRFEVSDIKAPQLIEEATENFAVAVTVTYGAQDIWDICC